MRWGSLSAAVLVAAVLTLAGCGDEPTPPLPADICQTAGTALLAQCAGQQKLAGQGKGDYNEPRGIGQQACQRVDSRPNETDVELLVRNGADQINVAYRGFDGRLTATDGVAGARELARALLAKLN